MLWVGGVSVGTINYAQNNQYYQLGRLTDDSSFITVNIASHSEGSSGVASIARHYNGNVHKSVIGSICSCKLFHDANYYIYVYVPSGALNSMLAVSNKKGRVAISYNVTLPSDAVEI